MGIDVGTHSVGLATLRVDDQGTPIELLSALSLIHDSGIGEGGKKTASTRKEISGVARRARRLLRRRRKRLQQLDKVLLDLGFPIPKPGEFLDLSEQTDPYRVWRVRARLVEEKLPEELRGPAVSMAVRHIARHRGWRNPYSKVESLLSPAEDSPFMEALRERIMTGSGEILDDGITPGQAMAQVALTHRITMRGPDGILGKLHQSDNANEIRKICDRQGISPDVCKQLLQAVFKAESPRGSAVSRVAPDPLPGQGSFRRAPKCDPEFQRFRIVSIVANLRISETKGKDRPLTADERRQVVAFLLEDPRDDLTWVDVAEKLGVSRQALRGTATLTADGERSAAQPPVNVTDQIMRKTKISALKTWWVEADAERQGAMVRYLYEGLEDSECAEVIAELPEEDQAKLDSLHLPAGRAAYSRESLAALSGHMLATTDDLHEARKQLFGVDDSWAPPAEPVGAPVGNPSVDRTLKAVARYLAAVENVWGKPEVIQVEHVRDGFASERAARERDRANNRRYEVNQRAIKEIQQSYGVEGHVRPGDVMRHHAITLQDSACLYCGGTIGYHTSQLDHIVPQAGTGSNNHRENLVAVCERCNRSKSNTPFAVWAQTCGIPDVGVKEAIDRVRRWRNRPGGMSPGELKRLKKEVIARLQRTQEDPEIDERSMESVAWMANELRHRIAAAYPDADVMVYRGAITAAARKAAGIDSRINLIGEKGRKDRIDRRHHAVDASVVALMERSAAKTLAERSSLRWAQRLTGQEETWKQYTGATVGARERFESWRGHMLRLTELFNERLAADEVHVVENLRLRLGSGNAHDDTIRKYATPRLGDGLSVNQIDRASSPALWCALTREEDFDAENGLPAREDRFIQVHGREIKSDDHIQLFSKKKKTEDNSKEKPFGAIAVRGGYAEIGSTIHHARIYRIEGKKPVYAMLRVFTHDLLSHRHEDLFSAVVPPQSISMRCAEPKLRQAIAEGDATYLGWVVVGDELEINVSSFTKDTIGRFLEDYPNTTRWRICGYDANNKLTLKPRILAAEGLGNPSSAVSEIVEGKGWRVAINVLAKVQPTVVRRDALGRPRYSSRSNLPVSWTIN
ncbi:type II CRISPR RNA-guided endonuclease Cas9 [Actinomyces oris]|uniref:type II CRISPR RNA-guided endonuclease Cas9 n=1 Tax=Actinomyces oris TaxID=544580 RepID=UPI0021166D73|nr:type II CRISPR RNA-guided endonuclease Cas9 [Actinomyces oris]